MRMLFRALVVLVFGIVAVIAAAVAVYQVNYPSYTHRYRLTVDVERGLRRFVGSGVIEVTWTSQPELGPAWNCRIRGDAVVTDIENTRVVAMLDRGNTSIPAGTPCWLALQSYGLGVQQSHESLTELSKKRGRVQVPRSLYPAFAIFTDENLPSTVIAVQPEEFPYAVRANILGVWLELTDAPLTRGVVTKIPAVEKLVIASMAKAPWKSVHRASLSHSQATSREAIERWPRREARTHGDHRAQ